jgi:hypothetical protein
MSLLDEAKSCIWSAIEEGDVGNLRKLFSNLNSSELAQLVNDPQESSDETPLYVAAKLNQVASLRYLIKKGANIDAPPNALRTAVEFGFLEVAATLLFHGADVNATRFSSWKNC